jgi:hypothetical protein
MGPLLSAIFARKDMSAGRLLTHHASKLRGPSAGGGKNLNPVALALSIVGAEMDRHARRPSGLRDRREAVWRASALGTS